jgi:hypothetical protein
LGKSLCISFTFSEYWDKHADVQLVQWIQAKAGEEQARDDGSGYTSEEEDKEEEEEKDNDDDDDDEEEEEEASNQQPRGKTESKQGSDLEDSDSDTELGIRNKFSVLSRE